MPNNDSNKGGSIMNKEQVYSPYKIVHHQECIQELRDGKQTNPLVVQFVPSNRCNFSCSYCPYRMDNFTHKGHLFDCHQIIPYKKVIECFDNFKEMGVKGITFTGGGEPLTHPNAYEILKGAIDRSIDVSLITNGALLNEKKSRLLADCSWVRVSLDAANAFTHSETKGIGSAAFRKTLDNIKGLVKHKKRCLVGIGFVVCKDNYKEILEAAKIAKELGVDNFRISGASTPAGIHYFDDFKKYANALATEAQSLTDDNFTVFNLMGDKLNAMTDMYQDYDNCPSKDLITYVGADLKVYTCCIICYNEKGLIGSIENQSFKQLWESDEKKKFFESLNPREHCAGYICTYKNKNKFINYCIEQNPEHVNFI